MDSNKLRLELNLDLESLPSPCFITDETKLKENLNILDYIQKQTGAKILLALKAFAQYSLFDLISRQKNGVLYGCCASSPDEARLAKEEFGGEVHAFAAAISESDFTEFEKYADHLVFNSFNQWKKFKNRCGNKICGLRINPEHSEGAVAIYNPCDPRSRLGIRLNDFQAECATDPQILSGISGLHFHTLCEQGAEELARTLNAVEEKFGPYLQQMQWLNFGGGHHITKEGYNIDLLCSKIKYFQDKYQVQVYLEPGEAVALNAGYLVSTVLDIIQADIPIALLDTSAACHMPDVLEMPYRPNVVFSSRLYEAEYNYRLAGKSCLSGDVIGEYSFTEPLNIGDKLVFMDMAIYSMVKTTTFNGLRLASITSYDRMSGELRNIKHFNYADFKHRLA